MARRKLCRAGACDRAKSQRHDRHLGQRRGHQMEAFGLSDAAGQVRRACGLDRLDRSAAARAFDDADQRHAELARHLFCHQPLAGDRCVGGPAAHGKVIGDDDGGAAIDHAAADHAICRRQVGQVARCIVLAEAGDGAELVKAVRVEQLVDALAHREPAAVVLALDLVGAAHLPRECLALAQFVKFGLPVHRRASLLLFLFDLVGRSRGRMRKLSASSEHRVRRLADRVGQFEHLGRHLAVHAVLVVQCREDADRKDEVRLVVLGPHRHRASADQRIAQADRHDIAVLVKKRAVGRNARPQLRNVIRKFATRVLEETVARSLIERCEPGVTRRGADDRHAGADAGLHADDAERARIFEIDEIEAIGDQERDRAGNAVGDVLQLAPDQVAKAHAAQHRRAHRHRAGPELVFLVARQIDELPKQRQRLRQARHRRARQAAAHRDFQIAEPLLRVRQNSAAHRRRVKRLE